ncbi:hypothetical protein [Candidatus Nitrospira allomarina]|uniref:Uncharacterized protein n=1 Tax=Candidatus Nitrospira allomarina TaxID=3020900 RepID=A0AA96G8B6_9BACT|nr:hypothetical protein [Candidatus Nitrospira allomarina]WNM56612.1 hypothetical protein PP769_11545 [Candidatus Nitrospira allomarina]
MSLSIKVPSHWKTTVLLGSCVYLLAGMTVASGGEKDSTETSQHQSTMEQVEQDGEQHHQFTLLPGHRVITGVVEGVAADQAKVNSGDSGEISPRYLSIERAKEKGFTLKEGDKVTIVVNAKNHVVDYHLSKEKGQSHHNVIKGRLAQPLKVGQDHAVIKTKEGKEQSFPVRPLARSEVAAIPFDTDGLFLIDETNKIASATLTNDVIAEDDWARSTAYNVYRHIQGVVQDEPKKQSLTIQTKDKESLTLPVWDYLQGEMTDLSKGTPVTVLVDSDDKIVDIAHVPQNGK